MAVILIHGKNKNYNNKIALTLIEILLVVVILATLALGLVPTAEIITVQLLEDELRQNLKEMRDAIDSWKNDCEKAVEKQIEQYLLSLDPPQPEKLQEILYNIEEYKFYPPDLSYLVSYGSYRIEYIDPFGNNQIAEFFYRPYLHRIPRNPFVNNAFWTQYYAFGNNEALWRNGEIIGLAGLGVYDVGVPTDTAHMNGFVQALDGSYYKDW